MVEREYFCDGQGRDDDASGVGGSVSCESFDAHGEIEPFLDAGVIFYGFL